MSNYKSYLPRERAKTIGVRQLTDYELLALIIRTGSKGLDVLTCAQNILQAFGSLQKMGNISIQQLEKLSGIGSSKAIGILAAIEIGRRVYKTPENEQMTINSPKDCLQYFENDFTFTYQECFLCLFLTTKNQVIAHREIYRGGLQAVSVHPREIFRSAIEVSAASFILFHNHPSGNPEPSVADIETTKSLLAVAAIIGIPILDHIILGQEKYVSLKEAGYLEFP